ncbi:hypothetical protein GCM10018777_18200 [Streptomyces albogriseolus]|nr:hypothetical protein GCM10018777_18200 [Streptomyces viridodiastaticus]
MTDRAEARRVRARAGARVIGMPPGSRAVHGRTWRSWWTCSYGTTGTGPPPARRAVRVSTPHPPAGAAKTACAGRPPVASVRLMQRARVSRTTTPETVPAR